MATLSTNPVASVLYRIDLETMSRELFGIPYDVLKRIVYPHPRYRTFLISKRNGGHRTISEPKFELKQLQLKLLDFLIKKHPKFKPCVHGFIRSRSILTNANQHVGERTNFLLNIDIENFFPSINFYRVRGMFMSPPLSFAYPVATVLAHICCYNNSLPQGAPTSPIIANLICRKMDSELMALARECRATYTRYSDDITFSFSVKEHSRLPARICVFDGLSLILGNELIKVIHKNSFSINSNKSRISNKNRRLEVTGLTINEFPNVKRKYIDEIRGALNAWDKYGYHQADNKFKEKPYKRLSRKIEDKKPALKNYLRGKLLFLKMIRGSEDIIYTKLAEQFNYLAARDITTDPTTLLHVQSVVKNQDDAEKATFVVLCEVDGYQYSQGTAFCIGDKEFITCEHVMKHEGEYFDSIPKSLIKIMDAKTKKFWKVKIAYKNDLLDLAILEIIDKNVPNCKHFSFSNSVINRGQAGVILGFPNYSHGRLVANHEGANVLNIFNRNALSRLEVSHQIRKGNSGGPFVDHNYNLLGVVQAAATHEMGNNECLSANELKIIVEKYRAEKQEKIKKYKEITNLRNLLQIRLMELMEKHEKNIVVK